MGYLDVEAPQMMAAQSSYETQAGVMRSAIAAAEQAAVEAQAHHTGESAVAFQAAHVRFVEAAAKYNTELDLYGAQLGEGGTTYTTEDSTGASTYSAAVAL